MATDLFPFKKFLRPDEVAHALVFTRRTIYRMIRDGRLPALKLNPSGPWRIPRENIISLITAFR
jgi:excisionase family DNA binding protein